MKLLLIVMGALLALILLSVVANLIGRFLHHTTDPMED